MSVEIRVIFFFMCRFYMEVDCISLRTHLLETGCYVVAKLAVKYAIDLVLFGLVWFG